jgi:hypothetical protein
VGGRFAPDRCRRRYVLAFPKPLNHDRSGPDDGRDGEVPGSRATNRPEEVLKGNDDSWRKNECMLKIEFESNGAGRHIRLIGRVRADNIAELSSQIVADDERTTLDLREVTIVDLAAVRFLLSCEKKGLELMNCPLYIREWIAREQNTPGK